jgi:hypothetical protein
MNRAATLIFLAVLLAITGGARDTAPSTGEAPASSAVTFAAVHVYIDPHGKPLACYQMQIVATAGDVALVGIEGGESAAFGNAPYYDPRALRGKRIIIGAFSLNNDLPAGKTRVATLMFQITGNVRPDYQVTLQVAASSDERSIPATVSLEPVTALRRGESESRINGEPR